MANPFLGKWKITEMEQWDRDFIDMEVPGYIEIQREGAVLSGKFSSTKVTAHGSRLPPMPCRSKRH